MVYSRRWDVYAPLGVEMIGWILIAGIGAVALYAVLSKPAGTGPRSEIRQALESLAADTTAEDYVSNDSDRQFQNRINAFCADLEAARMDYLKQSSSDERLFPDLPETGVAGVETGCFYDVIFQIIMEFDQSLMGVECSLATINQWSTSARERVDRANACLNDALQGIQPFAYNQGDPRWDRLGRAVENHLDAIEGLYDAVGE